MSDFIIENRILVGYTGADERRRRRLDGAEPLFCPMGKMQIESSLRNQIE